MPEPTPGETAYATYWHALAPAHGGLALAPFAAMGALHQAAWEAAAQAVQDRVMQDLIAGPAQARQERQDRREEETP